MISHGNEIMEPEELTQLGAVFDETWAALRASTGDGSPELQTALASTLLRLAHLRQLDPEQMKATALRIFRCEPLEPHYRSPLTDEGLSCSA
jgi:hypothetical protein